MQIFCKYTIPGQEQIETTLEVEPNSFIAEVKAKLQEKTLIKTTDMVLQFQGETLSDELTLSDYNILRESILFLTIINQVNCHSTENCEGIYINDTCSVCEQDISVYHTPPTTDNSNTSTETQPNNNSYIYILIGIGVLFIVAIVFSIKEFCKNENS